MLSCAPKWAHPTPNDLAWRDHWMQAIYYPISKIKVDISLDKELRITSNHDEYCLWFDVGNNVAEEIKQIAMPTPTAGIHTCVSRTRLGQINDSKRNEKYIRSFRQMLKSYILQDQCLPKNILCISDLSLLPLIASVVISEFESKDQTDKVRIHTCESNSQMRNFLKQCENQNQNLFRNVEIVYYSTTIAELEFDDLPKQVIIKIL